MWHLVDIRGLAGGVCRLFELGAFFSTHNSEVFIEPEDVLFVLGRLLALLSQSKRMKREERQGQWQSRVFLAHDDNLTGAFSLVLRVKLVDRLEVSEVCSFAGKLQWEVLG